jgi:hypothetical protein
MTLHVIIADPRSTAPRATVSPNVTPNDQIIFAALDESKTPPVSFVRYTVSTENVPYSNRTSIRTVIQNAAAIDATAVQEIENAADEFRVYNLTQVDANEVIAGMIAYLKTFADEDVDLPNLEGILESLTSGTDVTIYNIDGTEYVPPPAVPIGIDAALNSTTTDGIIGMIKIIDPALKYLGFSPRHSRSVFIRRSNNDTALARDLLLCFSAYAHIANNVAKLNQKRVDLDVSRKVMGAVNGMGIVKKATQKDHLTLPRIAIAFMPEYFIYRSSMVTNLQNQTSSTAEVVYKDIIFHGCDAISSKPGYLQFHKEFSALIYKPGDDTDIADEKFLKNYNRWSKITQSGYKNDTGIHARMATVLTTTYANRESALDAIIQGITHYRANP